MGKSIIVILWFIINQFIDLKQMTGRLNSGYYCSIRLFIADMKRIFNNCKVYNERNSDYVRCALILEKYFVGKMKELKIWIDIN